MKALPLLVLLFAYATAAQVKPLANAHAHNDYEHASPLLDALAQGFTSVEADVHLAGNELYVSHDAPRGLDSARTLKMLYLNPLRERVRQNAKRVYPGYDGVFRLMVDFKTNGEATCATLRRQLRNYPELADNPFFVVFVSGNRPVATILNDTTIAVDGRPEDLTAFHPASRMPVISENFNKVCRWNGQGQMPEAEFLKVKTLADQTHAQGKKLRLWAIPDQPNAWATLLQAGVDLINTDRLADLGVFLRKRMD